MREITINIRHATEDERPDYIPAHADVLVVEGPGDDVWWDLADEEDEGE